MKHTIKYFILVFYVACFAQQSKYVDFTTGSAILKVVPDSSEIAGAISYKFDVVKPVDSVFIDAKHLKVDSVLLNKKPVLYSYNNKILVVRQDFKPSQGNKISISYSARPKKALYFLTRNEDWNIWTQGQGKYTSNWLPSFDDVNEKVVFEFNFEVPEGYQVISNGSLLGSPSFSNGSANWKFSMNKPMSSYLVALAIGKYRKKKETAESGIPLELYYYPEDSLKVGSTYRYSKRMFDFLEKEIGYPYPWLNYKQVPVHDFLYAGMENTGATIFSDAFVVDEIGFNDKNYINANAHELAHQWFGNLVTATSGEHHWLQEGFATYYALLAEREIFGDDYYHFKLYESAVDLGRQDIAGQGTSLLNPKASSLTFYQRGAWVLVALRSIIGDQIFKKAVQNYLNNYAFGSVKSSDFITEVETLYDKNLDSFVNTWITNEKFPAYSAIDLLKERSTFIQEYLMVDCEVKSSKCEEYLKYGVSDEAKIKVISQAPELVTKDTFKSSLKVRQAIAQYLTKIPVDLKDEYESLLDDASYLTVESALYNLWNNFPLDRAKYLSKTRNIHGFNDKNIRLLWIVLNLNTPYYNAESNQELYAELTEYTSAKYNADLRINAFQYLKLIGGCNELCKQNLDNAKSHHNWRMIKFAKDFDLKLEEKKN
ncbi:M1 family metallopeptidase [Winogradskyella alexanderae]|uniref:Aminopeptidase N n=1 Tax=Winogradskyella alexanderae TaxID=2877123 RepID=A0ABS7XS06_9FLAO|nr:M1 family metallopeptidase [Winogradskyella alexanderae]MCA0131811.1 M1 family metallopeptidase [Winogradskyella alexanderae]